LDKLQTYLRGRATRSEYWIWMAFIVAGTMTLNIMLRSPALVSAISFAPWAIIGPRRLRDFGRSGWWCLSTVGSGFVLGILFGMINSIAQAQGGGPALPKWVLLVACGVASWSIIIYIGAQRSVAARASSEVHANLIKTFE